jgi:quercetin dioxygenase-like cupin family protein
MSSALRRVRWIPLLVVSLLTLGGGAAIGFALGAGDPAPVVREPLAQTSKARGAPERTLALTRITIQPGTRLALHHHPGTQIAYVDRGVLTYTVEQGSARVKRGPADDHPVLVRKLEAGDTARLVPGQWIVEQPSDHHHAANKGDRPVVLYLSTLFPKGAPPSIPG